MSTIVPNRVTSSSSSSSSQIKQEHVKDENDNSSRNSNNDDFFDDWKIGNWCWERDYNKYPVVVVALHTASNNSNNNCHDTGNGINDRSNDAKMNTTEHYEQCDDERTLCDSDIDERKPAAINYSCIDSGRVTTTASAMREIAVTKKDAREIAINKNPQVKVENNDEKNNTNDINDFNHNKYNENNNDDDDSFYDDWVEGNWCLLDNSDNSNGEVEGKGDDDNAPRKMHHEVKTPSETTKMTVQKKKLKRSRYDDDNSYNKDDEDEEEESDDENNNIDNKEEEEFIREDNQGIRNHHQEDKRPVKKRSRRCSQRVNGYDQIWMGMFQKLVQYKKQYKNTMVPSRYNNDPKLGIWVSSQRKIYRKDELDLNRVNLLESVGFIWEGKIEIHNQVWMGMFEKLVQYKKQHGNTMVPQIYDEDPKLGIWIGTQRYYYKKDELSPNRVDLLNSINFIWEGKLENHNKIWLGMFEKLVQYKKQHKNTLVPNHYGKDPKLAKWVDTQRQIYKNDDILPNRLALLKSIGFKWNGSKEHHKQLWMGMFHKFVAYNEQHKNTLVPSRDSKLGRWVHKQRHFYNRGELLPARIALLKSIGFAWRWVGVKIKEQQT